MPTPMTWGTEFLVNSITANYQDDPAITALANGKFVATWVDKSQTLGDSGNDSAIHAQLFNADGSTSGAEFLVNTTTTFYQQEPAVTALSDGGFVATWTDSSGANQDVRAQVFNADGVKSGPEFLVNTITAQDQYGAEITTL